jgi:MFS transporter, DHA2 family, multidrug resistance protein
MSQGSDPYSANLRAIGAMGDTIRRQAFLLAYSDCFLVLGCVLLASAIALVFMKKSTHLGCGWWTLMWNNALSFFR